MRPVLWPGMWGKASGPRTRGLMKRACLGRALPSATKFRRVGLITYGPGPYQQCNVKLDLEPTPNAAELIMGAVNALTPAGRTPLTSAVAQAAEVLDFRHKRGLIVVVTDGEETCGGSPCELAKALRAAAEQLTIHVIGYRTKGFSWTGEQSLIDAKCLADQSGGLYIAAETEEDLIVALEKTLGCPMVTQRAPWAELPSCKAASEAPSRSAQSQIVHPLGNRSRCRSGRRQPHPSSGRVPEL